MRYEKPVAITLNGRMVSGQNPLGCVEGGEAIIACGVGKGPIHSAGCMSGVTNDVCVEGGAAVIDCVSGLEVSVGDECTFGSDGDTSHRLCGSGSIAF